MSPENTTQLVLALLGLARRGGALGWSRTGRDVWPPVSLVLLAAAAGGRRGPRRPSRRRPGGHALLVVLAGAAAVVGGGPVTAPALRARRPPDAPTASTTDHPRAPASVLRGGAWIGALERLPSSPGSRPASRGRRRRAGPQGVGRFPDLRAAEDGVRTGATERFIIGTFASVLWAAACAGVVVLAR